jgi:hypothetical protein
VQFLAGNIIGSPAATAMMSFYERVLPDIITRRAFSMRNPGVNGPRILEAIRTGDTAMQRMANMVLATEAAAKRNLSEDLRGSLRRIGAPRESLLPPQNKASGQFGDLLV